MSEEITCNHCSSKFNYESEIVGGATKDISNKNLGSSKGIFSNTPKSKKQNTLLICNNCQKEDYYKVMVNF